MQAKTLTNISPETARVNVPDIEVVGDPGAWKVICKASSKSEGWMKSTKAMTMAMGVLVQVTTQQGGRVAEALTFVPGACLEPDSEREEIYTIR